MRQFIYKYFIIVIFFFNISKADTRFVPRNIHVGLDLAKIIYYGGGINIFNDYTSYIYTAIEHQVRPNCPEYSGMQYEFNFGIDYKLLNWNVDVGFGSARWKGFFFDRDDNDRIQSEYESTGFFIKYGLDFNFLPDTYENNAAYLGFRHAISFFSDSMKSHILYAEEQIKKDQNHFGTRKINKSDGEYDSLGYTHIEDKQENLFANWFEIVAGVRLKMKSWIYLGCNLRYKFLLFMPNFSTYQPYDIIGWGTLNDPLTKTALGYNFYVHIGIPMRGQDPYDRKEYRKNGGKIDLISL